VSGADSIGTAEFTLFTIDSKGVSQPLANQKVTFSLAISSGRGSLLSTTGTTNASGKVTVQVQAATVTSSNNVIATVVDTNGVSVSSAISFDTVVGNKVFLSAAKTDLTSGGDSVDLSALVLSAAGGVAENVPVSFSLVNPNEKGVVLNPAHLASDANGKAKTTLSLQNITGYDPSNHTIQVKAAIGSGADYSEEIFSLNVTGTIIDLTTSNSSVKTGAKPVVNASLKNGKGLAITGGTVNFNSADVIDLATGLALNKSVKDSDDGSVDGNFVLNNVQVSTTSSKATIFANAQGAQANIGFDVSARNFELSFAKNGTAVSEIDIAQGGDVELLFKDDTVGVTLPDSIPVTVTTTLGEIEPPTVLTKVSGSTNTRKATIRLKSNYPGTATVQAVLVDPNTQKQIVASGTIALVSKIADKLAIQAVNPILAPSGQTNVVAKVLDANDNPVSGVVVNFNLENPLGGKLNSSMATTNDKGEAQVTFTAGSSVTGTEKVKVLATVPDKYTNFSGTRNTSLNLTVGGEAVFIAIATGNVIQELTSTTYAVPYQVTVTDATGAPVANKEVTLSVWPVNYYKGFYVYNEEKKLWIAQYTSECSNEDANQNGQLDSWENNKVGNALSPLDYPAGQEIDVEDNGDGKLWPGNPVTLSTSKLTTGADGIAYFNVLYGQSYASWLRVKLTARAEVSGTESKTDRVFGLSASSEDLSSDKSTPPGGSQSVYGTATVCSDPN